MDEQKLFENQRPSVSLIAEQTLYKKELQNSSLIKQQNQ
jgi:hypothetical protein